MAIINFGSVNIDHVYQVDHFVNPGETIASQDYQQLLGGKGANQSIALAAAGADVKHVGKINQSDSAFKQTLIKHGIDCQFLQCVESPSGHAIIQVIPSGENAIVLFGGANQEIGSKDILHALDKTRPSDWVLTQNETSGLAEMLQLAKEKKLRVAFNPAPMSESVKSLPHECIDLLVVNEVEAAELSGEHELDAIIAHFKTKWSHAEVIITLGKAGVIMLKNNETIQVDAFIVDAVDTTAAGDTFIGYFLAAYSQHADARQALKRGCAASAISVTRMGAAQSIPAVKDVDRFLAKYTK
ncbi:ribokinase [Alteromonas gilva]|uniref:Ribokinase n=1 Tax=Alteromonas gilva TaxID=2987522 RepID=A0ABT5KZK6_9ALTE|nr:ribokinase [Alteromonas gilva]MDC8830205.1 ribokinase [Alteromonas gilva]